MRPGREDRPPPRTREIEAAIAAYNDADPDMLLKPEGLGMKPQPRLLQHLVEIGFVSKERHTGPGSPNVYRVHPPPVRR
jgi:hypothetical protein